MGIFAHCAVCARLLGLSSKNSDFGNFKIPNISWTWATCHIVECKLFEDCGYFKADPVTTYKVAKGIYMYLTPLRFLLKTKTKPDLMKLNSKLEERTDTLIYFLNMSKVVKPLHTILGLGQMFSEDQIQVFKTCVACLS